MNHMHKVLLRVPQTLIMGNLHQLIELHFIMREWGCRGGIQPSCKEVILKRIAYFDPSFLLLRVTICFLHISPDRIQ
jgi:hypothetical protein